MRLLPFLRYTSPAYPFNFTPTLRLTLPVECDWLPLAGRFAADHLLVQKRLAMIWHLFLI
jgi:hypothetical protein